VKHFCNARSAISNIQDIEIINAFHDGVSDIKIVEDICDVCIESSEAQDREVNATDHENHKQQPTDQKEKRSFRSPANAEKWYEIHCTTWYDLEECRTFLDHKMSKKSAAQKPR
jgi:hypothetical protein